MNVTKPLTGEPSPPYGLTIRLAFAYQAARRLAVSSRYIAFRQGRDPREEKNFPHFERAAAMMKTCGCRSEEEWIDAQFVGANPHNYPRPNNLYSPRAARNWVELCETVSTPGEIEQQKSYLEHYLHKRPGATETDVVLDPFITFESWFRVYFATQVTPALAQDAARELSRSTALRNCIQEAGFDLEALELKIRQLS